MNYEKEIEVLGKYDVVVAGAGPAGICAAVAAARQGKKVALRDMVRSAETLLSAV